jgi:hypothetical protein
MKSPVIFRAAFEFPQGALNPLGWKLPGPVWVEIFHHKVGPPAEWKARRPDNKNVFEKITPQSAHTTLMNQIKTVYFGKQLEAWRAFDATIAERPEELQADEWAVDPKGRVYLTDVRRANIVNRNVAETNRKLMGKEQAK